MQTTVLTNQNGIESNFIREIESLKEIDLILTSKSIERLILGFNTPKKENYLSALEGLKDSKSKVFESWNNFFPKPLTLEDLQEIFTKNIDLHLKNEWIKVKGIDKDLPFVKTEKLAEIVDFPDFNDLISTLEELKGIFENPVFRIINLKDAFGTGAGKYPKSFEEKLNEDCEIVLTGRSNIEKYANFYLLLKASNGLKSHFKNPHFGRLIEAIYDMGLISNPQEQWKDYSIRKDNIFKSLFRAI